jgi:hypothetical protein
VIQLVWRPADAVPDWDAAARYIDALVLEEIGKDLAANCGVDPAQDPPDVWLERVQRRLRADVARFRDDVETDHDEIEQWQLGDELILASSGSWEDEAKPDSGHGWMCRLADAGVLVAAGFHELRKADLVP